MKLPVATRYALRSLFRHRRRTILSVVGIAVGCGICLFMISFVRGEGEMMMRAAAESGTGHLRIAPREWVRTRTFDARLDNGPALLREVRKLDAVKVAAPHARVGGLLAMGTRTAAVTLCGVLPSVEPRINRLVQTVQEGTYLEPGQANQVVVGHGVAQRLDVGVGNDLMVTASGVDGQMRSEMLRVQGIVRTGSQQLDASLCHVALETVESLTGADGPAEISLLLHDPDQSEAVAEHVRDLISSGQAVVGWEVIVPELASGVEVDETWTRLTVGIVVVVVFLGIASAQLAAVLERRREFAVLSALGMRGGRLVRVMLAEGVFLGAGGAVAALFVGAPFCYWSSTAGIDFGGMYGEMDLGMSNILLEPIIYGEFG